MKDLIKEIEGLKVNEAFGTGEYSFGLLEGINKGITGCLDILNQHNLITAPKQIKLSEIVERLSEIYIGCPLEVVFKAVENGIVIIGDISAYSYTTLWLDTKPTTALIGEKHDFEEPRLIKYNEWCFSCDSGSYSGCVALKEYGKTWWLKGDMEHEKY